MQTEKINQNLAKPKSSSPRRRMPSPPGKVDRAQPGTDEGKNPLLGEGGSAKPRRVWGGTNSDPVPPLFRPLRGHLPPGEGWRAAISRPYGLSHSSWPGSLGELGPPHPSGPKALPPSPKGKATSRRGLLDFGSAKSLFVLHKNAPKAGAFGEKSRTEPLIPLHKHLALLQAVAAGGQAEL